ncbi:uncharacterized protein bou isoform X2 [Venturia canescens]|uniref:uncharacterized protein bou isoform X2 n=1 Tax=Venturia canescens TaxID=32260 RepID=UPI001C9C8472|nr:uncharacterized protein LOC122410274 isoform X2 [Venturia canescens]
MASAKIVFECFTLFIVSTLFVVPAAGIYCYQCVSTNNEYPFQCNEFLTSDIDMEPKSCDAVHGAKFCVKHVGRFEVLGINCYQCTSANEWKCMDSELVENSLELKSCDHVFEAQYCIKTIGRYGDGVGTKRFCSSADLGNYCQTVQQVGDERPYRTCLYTCNTDGCNPGSMPKPNSITTAISLTLLFLLRWTR